MKGCSGISYPMVGLVDWEDMQAEAWEVATQGKRCPNEAGGKWRHIVQNILCRSRCASIPNDEMRDEVCERLGQVCWQWVFERMAMERAAQAQKEN